MSRPSFCPNCGAALPDDDRAAVPIGDPKTVDGGYECYCGACGWPGDILPDDEQEIYE